MIKKPQILSCLASSLEPKLLTTEAVLSLYLRKQKPTTTTVLGSTLQSCRRSYTTLGSGLFRPKQYTKYRVTSDFSPNSDYEDIYLAEPSRDDLMKFTKEGAAFLRFLKLVADKEGRPEAFKAFAKRCEAGLVVEKDVYVTKAELLEALWENGFSQLELNAYEIAFPANYRFHYPELAVLFQIEEEDCYKYCLKKRATKPDDLIEVKHKPTGSKIASYGLLTTGLWFGLQNNVLGNMWMMVKTWPFFAVFYMIASHFQKSIMAKVHSDSVNEARIAQENRLEGEERVYLQIKKYANDSLCYDYLESFKPSVTKQLRQYRRALLEQLKTRMVEGITKHLVAVQKAEKAVESLLQDVIVRETIRAFNEAYASNEALRNSAFDAAVEALSHTEEVKIRDPVGDFFRGSFKELAAPVEGQPLPASSFAGLVNAVFETHEKEFLDRFTVSEAEVHMIREIYSSVKRQVGLDEETGDLNLNEVSDGQIKTIEKFYHQIMSKVGLDCLALHLLPSSPEPLTSVDPSCSSFLNHSNEQVRLTDKQLRTLQLRSFMNSFS